MTSTLNRGYRYPNGPTSPNNVPLDMQQLAEDVDADVSRIIARNKGALTADSTGYADATERQLATSTGTLLSASLPTEAGVEYRIELQARPLSTVAGDRINLRIRRTNATGPIVYEALVTPAFASVGVSALVVGYDSPGAGTTTYVATITRAGGTGTVRNVAAVEAPTTLVVKRA